MSHSAPKVTMNKQETITINIDNFILTVESFYSNDHKNVDLGHEILFSLNHKR